MNDPATVVQSSHVEEVMGTTVTFDVRDENSGPAISAAIDWLHHVDEVFSPYKPESPISKFGLGELTIDELSDEVRDVLALCDIVNDDTNGAFNAFEVPAPNGSMFNPSGLVKGWALEISAEILEQFGLRNFTINGGGDIAVRGTPLDEDGWRIGIRHPYEANMFAEVVQLRDHAAIATSATYERGAHIVDPETGTGTTDLASVTIIGPDLTFVDVYATSVFVMGNEGLVWLLDSHPECEGFAIGHDGFTYATPGFSRYVVQ